MVPREDRAKRAAASAETAMPIALVVVTRTSDDAGAAAATWRRRSTTNSQLLLLLLLSPLPALRRVWLGSNEGAALLRFSGLPAR